jgi:3-deoxy-D-manno-octulosonate 8-phosphate phosphatase (KDO 8-P phosphatase)
MKLNFKEKLTKIKAFVFDVDGVFSGSFLVDNQAEYLRLMNAKDGFAVRYAVESGFIVGIITGGVSESVKMRFNYLGITDIYLNSRNKIEDFEDFYYKYNLKPEEILYMGDDLPDYEILATTNVVATCPADAVREIIEVCEYISDKNGGEGCVRDVVEQVLRSQNKWNYLKKTAEN